MLARLLQRMMGADPERPQAPASLFCGLRAPAICLSSYLERIFKYANCSPACYVLAFIYLERLLAVRWPAAVARAHRLARGRAVLGAG